MRFACDWCSKRDSGLIKTYSGFGRLHWHPNCLRLWREFLSTTLPGPAEQDATYHAALELVAQIDEGVTRGTGHYYTKSGRLLTTLDEVIRAILSGDLMGVGS